MYLSPLLPFAGGPEARCVDGAPLGLSCVHTSNQATEGAILGVRSVPFEARALAVPINGWGPIVQDNGVQVPAGARGLELGGHDSVVTYRRGVGSVSIGVVPVRDGMPKRGTIKRFSGASRSRMVQVLSDLVAPYRFMGTLTVGRDWSRDGVDFKARLDKFLVWFMARQRELSDCPAEESLFWFLEFQARGTPHVHFFYTTRVPWQESAARWAGIMGDPQLERTGTKFETLRARGHACAYARKYARKSEQKTVPGDYTCPGRFWGVRGCRIRATFKVQMASTEGGGGFLREMTALLESARSEGLLRRLSWERGEGAIYFIPREYDSLYEIPWKGPEGWETLGQAVDRLAVMSLLRE